MLSGENGIIIQAQNAKEETRGASVQEYRNLWFMNKQEEKLEDLLNNLVQQKLLTENEKNEIIGNEEKGILPTGKVNIGSRTIDFGSLKIVASLRMVVETNNLSEAKKGIVCQIYDNEKNQYANFSIEEKEKILLGIFNSQAIMTNDQIFNTEKELLTAMYEGLLEVEINSFEEWYNLMKDADAINVNSYEEFLDKLANDYNSVYEYNILEPNGNSYTICAADDVAIPTHEIGTYKIIVKTLDGRLIGSTQIENIENKYYITYSTGNSANICAEIYDQELKNIVSIDNAYVYYEDEKIDVTDKIIGNERIYLSDIYNKLTYELELVTGTEKIKIPIVKVKNAT